MFINSQQLFLLLICVGLSSGIYAVVSQYNKGSNCAGVPSTEIIYKPVCIPDDQDKTSILVEVNTTTVSLTSVTKSTTCGGFLSKKTKTSYPSGTCVSDNQYTSTSNLPQVGANDLVYVTYSGSGCQKEHVIQFLFVHNRKNTPCTPNPVPACQNGKSSSTNEYCGSQFTALFH